MRVASSWSVAAGTQAAFTEAYGRLLGRLGRQPTVLLVHFTEAYDPAELSQQAAELPDGIAVHGCSTCRGVMTEDGFHGTDGRALGMLGIADPLGAYGIGEVESGYEAREGGRLAVERALDQAGRPGEVPHAIWLSVSPGREEMVLDGIADVVGSRVPVVGGSAADHSGDGRWSLLTRNAWYEDAILVTVLFPTLSLSYSFQSGYVPTSSRGRVTAASGRSLKALDGRPAAAVYREWTGDLLDDVGPEGGEILSASALAPLGRAAGDIDGLVLYGLSHPMAIDSDGSIRLFTEIEEGQEVVLMTGSTESLVSRAARVTDAAIRLRKREYDRVAGGVVVYCAGCMLVVEERMSEVAESIATAMRGRPFLGMFTFGEQGCLMGGTSSHGNLMISALVLSE